MAKDSAARTELGRSFHQVGTVNEKVCESDIVPLWDGTIMCRSLAERKLLEQGFPTFFTPGPPSFSGQFCKAPLTFPLILYFRSREKSVYF